MLAFNERQPKYRHCCCHIRIASYVIGILELLSVLYILAQHSVRSIIADVVQQNDNGKQTSSSSDSSTISSPTAINTRRWLGAGATTPLVTWAVCETLFLGLMFYGIARSRPWLLIPQLFLQVVTIIVCMILNILMVVVLAWHPYVSDIWYFLSSTVVFAFLYEYGLVVLIRCYRYLRDKAAYESQTAHGVFVLPTGANGEIVFAMNEAIMESRMYSDLPPEYAAAVTMMTVEDSQKHGSISEAKLDSKAEMTSTPDSTCREESRQQQQQQELDHPTRVDDNAPPPTYEEARQLQRTRSTTSSTN